MDYLQSGNFQQKIVNVISIPQLFASNIEYVVLNSILSNMVYKLW